MDQPLFPNSQNFEYHNGDPVYKNRGAYRREAWAYYADNAITLNDLWERLQRPLYAKLERPIHD